MCPDEQAAAAAVWRNTGICCPAPTLHRLQLQRNVKGSRGALRGLQGKLGTSFQRGFNSGEIIPTAKCLEVCLELEILWSELSWENVSPLENMCEWPLIDLSFIYLSTDYFSAVTTLPIFYSPFFHPRIRKVTKFKVQIVIFISRWLYSTCFI